MKRLVSELKPGDVIKLRHRRDIIGARVQKVMLEEKCVKLDLFLFRPVPLPDVPGRSQYWTLQFGHGDQAVLYN